MTEETPQFTRRTALRTTGSLALMSFTGVAGAQSEASQRGSDNTLRLFSEQAVDGATEAVTQGNYAYVATGDGLGVVDWHDPGHPEKVVDMNVPGGGVDDVKVDGDLLAISSQSGDREADIGTHFYDVSEPSDPQFQGTFQVLPAGVHNHYLDGDVCYVCKEYPFDESNLQIVDVSDPSDPTLLSTWAVEDVHPELDQPTNFLHDVYVQDDLAYLAYWDAGTRVLDVSDPADPVEVSGFGVAPDADEDVPLNFGDTEFARRLLGPPGNAHYVQPSPDGDHVYVGAEQYVGESGGIRVWDVSDLNNPTKVATIEALDRNEGIFVDTAHNFDVTNNRLHTSWYRGGTRVYDITDPSDPTLLADYDPDGGFYWTAVAARGFTIASDIGGGLVFLHNDRGEKRPPGFEGESANGTGPDPERHAGPE